MDKKLRELERQAAAGDPEAAERLASIEERAKERFPFLLSFGGGRILLPLWLTPHYSDALNAGYRLGSILPRDGILKSITAQTNKAPIQNYQINVGEWHGQKIYASSFLKAGNQIGYWAADAKIPALTPFGVIVHRKSGDQRSTFSAIQVNLEIWM